MNRHDRLARMLRTECDEAGLVLEERYEIVRRLARGGMGEVFEAFDRKLARRVAVKVVAAADPSLAARLAEEARTLARIEHPGIVPVHDIGTFPDGRLYYTMRFVAGRTLADLLADRMEPRRLVETLAGVCDIVGVAHERGVVHRDLKPANVMLDGDGRVVVLDWGCAALRSDRSESVAGTRGYMAPEQAAGAPPDPRSDVWSIGAILSEVPLDLDLAAIASRAIESDPTRRYPTAAAMGEDLRRHLRGEAVTARAELGYRLRKRFARSWGTVFLIASVLVALPLAVLFGVQGNSAARAFDLWRRVSRVLEDAETRSKLGDAAGARVRVEEGLALCDESPHGRYFRGRLLKAKGDRTGALREFDAAALPEARFERGLMLVEEYALRVQEYPPAGQDPEVAEPSLRALRERAMEDLAAGADEAIVGRAELARLRGELDEARRLLEPVTGSNAAAMLSMAKLQWQRGDTEGVIAWAGRAIAAHRGLADAHLLRCRALVLSRRDPAAAAADAERAMELTGGSPAALLAMGNVAFIRGGFAEAFTAYDRAVKADEGNAVAWGNRGVALQKLGRTAEALRDFDEAVRRAPKNAQLLANRGLARFGAGAVEGARIDLDEALRLVPTMTEAMGGRAAMKLMMGDAAGAREDAAEALRRDSGSTMALLVRARLRGRDGDLRGAEEDASAVLQRDTSQADAYAIRGSARAKLGLLEEAEADCTASLALRDNQPTVWVQRGIARGMRGHLEAAISDYTRALSLDPRNGPALANRAFARYIHGALDEALDDCNACLKLDPRDAEILLNRALIRLKRGDGTEAMADLTAAIAIQPGLAEARARRALLREGAGDRAGAMEDVQAIRGPLPPDVQAAIEELKRK